MDIKIVLNAWQHENDRVVFSGDWDQTSKQMRRKQRGFYQALIFSDVLEAGVATAMAVLYIFVIAPLFDRGRFIVYIGAASLLLLASFFVIDRIRQERGWSSRSLTDEIRHYLMRVDRRIYLLRNVIWWYLLPAFIAWLSLIVPVIIATIECWQQDPLKQALKIGPTVLIGIAAFYWAYDLNQRTVTKELLPRKQELEQLLHDLTQ